MSFTVVIPSKNASNLGLCSLSVFEHEPAARIIVVDDGLPSDLFLAKPAEFIPGLKPFVFARNCNIGIRAAGNDDVILLNDDALMKTPGGFTALAAVAAEHPEYGVISAVTNSAGNPGQFRKNIGLREEARMVCFVCVYIPRTTIERVGLLDERYVDYGMDDDDYCFSVRAAGLKIGIFDGCFVDHLSLKSSFRGEARAGGNFLPNLARFKQKWGVDNWGRPA